MMKRLRNNSLSSRDIRWFFMLRHMLVTKWRPPCHRRFSNALDR